MYNNSEVLIAQEALNCNGAFTHTLRWDGMGLNGLCCAVRCDAMFVFFMYMNIYIKMSDDDDDDALVSSATCCELMHINLYWSLIGCSLLVLARW